MRAYGDASSPPKERATRQEQERSEEAGLESDGDAGLVRRMHSDDLAAFEEFFARHRTLIYRTAYGLTGDSQAAEEVLQDTFVRAWQRRRSLRLDVSPLPWLHRVALNLCYTRLGRRKLRWEPIGEAVIRLVRDVTGGPPEHAERTELQGIVRDGIAALPPHQQAVVVLYYLQGLSLQEAAATLELPVGTVKSRLHYALRALRTHLEEDRRFGGAYRPGQAEAPSA